MSSTERCSRSKEKKKPSLTSLQKAEQNKLRPRRKQKGPRQPGDSLPRVIVNRVYMSDRKIRFEAELPEKLRARGVDEALWKKTLEKMYEFWDAAEHSGWKSCLETLGSLFTANLIWRCYKTTYEKNIEKLVTFVEEQNRSLYSRHCVHIVDPTANAFRELEILLLPMEPAQVVSVICPVDPRVAV